jgi:putative hemolysin
MACVFSAEGRKAHYKNTANPTSAFCQFSGGFAEERADPNRMAEFHQAIGT